MCNLNSRLWDMGLSLPQSSNISCPMEDNTEIICVCLTSSNKGLPGILSWCFKPLPSATIAWWVPRASCSLSLLVAHSAHGWRGGSVTAPTSPSPSHLLEDTCQPLPTGLNNHSSRGCAGKTGILGPQSTFWYDLQPKGDNMLWFQYSVLP